MRKTTDVPPTLWRTRSQENEEFILLIWKRRRSCSGNVKHTIYLAAARGAKLATPVSKRLRANLTPRTSRTSDYTSTGLRGQPRPWCTHRQASSAFLRCNGHVSSSTKNRQNSTVSWTGASRWRCKTGAHAIFDSANSDQISIYATFILTPCQNTRVTVKSIW